MDLKPTTGCQISTLIFEKQLWRGGLYKYPMKNISRTAKFLHLGLKLKVLPWSLTDLSA
jgi:hypothetical protein